MRRFIYGFIAFVLIAIAAYYLFLGSVIKEGVEKYNEYEANIEVLKEYVGETIVLKGDTLVAIDYSSVNGTLIMDNGLEVSPELIDKMKIDTDNDKYDPYATDYTY